MSSSRSGLFAMAMYPFAVADEKAQEATISTPPLRARRGRENWLVVASYQRLVLGEDAPSWLSLSREKPGGASLIKEGHGRSVFRVRVGTGNVYVKTIRSRGVFDRIRWRILKSPAEREWRKALAAEALGVPVVRPLAVGVRLGAPAVCALITEELPEAVDLAAYWRRYVSGLSAGRRKRAAQEVIREVALLFALAHERGFVHRDAHPGNVLMGGPRSSSASASHGLDDRDALVVPASARAKARGAGRESAQAKARGSANGVHNSGVAVFGDVHGSRVPGRAVTLRSAARSLAQLDQYFHRVATATERMRFVRCYLESRRTIARDAKPMPPVRAILNAVQAASTSHNERLVHQRDRRLRSRGAYFSAFDLGGGWRVTVVLKLERRHLFPEPGVPDRTESDWRRLLEPFLRSAGTESRDFDAATSEVCIGDGVRVEVSKSTGWAGRLAWTTTGSPHRRAFEHCHTMRHRDLNSPLVLGVMEHGNQILIDCSVLLMADPADD